MRNGDIHISGGDVPHMDLEAFQRWAIAVNDELEEAVDAMRTLEYPTSAHLDDDGDPFNSTRSSTDLVDDLIEEIDDFRENPDRPAWFTRDYQMVLWLSGSANLLMDYVEDITEPGSQVDDKRFELIDEKIWPAVDHFFRFLHALRAAGYLSGPASTAAHTGSTAPSSGNHSNTEGSDYVSEAEQQ